MNRNGPLSGPWWPSLMKEAAWGWPALPVQRGVTMPWSPRAGEPWWRDWRWRIGAHPTMWSSCRQPAWSVGSIWQGEEVVELT
jgi:hypothetical protein